MILMFSVSKLGINPVYYLFMQIIQINNFTKISEKCVAFFIGGGVIIPCPAQVECSIQPDKQDKEFKC